MSDSAANVATEAGTTAHLTVTTLMCGFAFAGFVLYLGTDHTKPAHIVAACLLVAAFVTLLYGAFTTAYLVEAESKGLRLTAYCYFLESVLVMFLGLAFLLASLSVMSFAWSPWTGWTSTLLGALFIVRYGWVSWRDIRLEAMDAALRAAGTEDRKQQSSQGDSP